MRSQAAGTATKVGDWSCAGAVPEFGEHAKQRTVQGLGSKVVADPLGVGGDCVVCRPSGAQVRRLDHCQGPYMLRTEAR
ncbi:MAG: hypothetical protein WA731_16605 [Pseudonocardiaceae bacterium]|nr:hypothetical protein [Pseudonocardiaceae bacterium]